MKLVIISDTHCNQFELPEGDVLIHCGDHTFHGHKHESYEALNWLSNAGKFKHRLYIAGNHELGWEKDLLSNRYRKAEEQLKQPTVCDLFPTLTYLHNSGVEIDGIKFWGSPVQPEFHGWAFQLPRGEIMKQHWKKIPDGTHILITHGPPKGLGDINKWDDRFGDEDLLERVKEVKPLIHCYGHAHHGTGTYKLEGQDTVFINAAVLSEAYKLTKKPVEIEIDAGKH